MEKLLRIGEVSQLYNISIDTLRYYDEIGLLKPIVKENGYRYYALEHLDILELILVSKYSKIPLKHVKEVIDSENIDEYEAMIKLQELKIDEEILKLQELKKYNKTLKKIIREIQNYKEDFSFETVKQVELKEVIHEMRLEDLIVKEEYLEVAKIEQFYYYNVDEFKTVTEDTETIGIKDPLKVLTKSQKYKQVSFLGTREECLNYIQKLVKYLDESNTRILVNFKFTLIKKDLNHDYFINIYVNEE